MISARHCAHWLPITLVTDTSLVFCVLKLPARHCKAVTRGTPKAQHRQAAGAVAQAVNERPLSAAATWSVVAVRPI
jgi:hypothetical protein